MVYLAVCLDLELEPFGKRVYHRKTDAVQAAGYLVCPCVELPACVKRRHYNLSG